MITEDYCCYEVAKLLEEKGFPMSEHLFMHVNRDNVFMTDDYACLKLPWEEYKNFDEIFVPTITHQMAMKWLREIHNIFIVIEPHMYDYVNEKNSSYVTSLWQGDNYYENITSKDYPTYEDAVEAALKYCLTNLI